MNPEQYRERTYRQRVRDDRFTTFEVVVRETDLQIHARERLGVQAEGEVIRQRALLEAYIRQAPSFLTSLVPEAVPPSAPAIVSRMAAAGQAAGVGPMAAVAGAMAQCVGRFLLTFSPEVIVENGGDVFVHTRDPVTVAIYAGDSPLYTRIGLRLGGEGRSVGVCTSSGTVGHSLSTGCADAACVIAPSCALADALATAIGNRVRGPGDIEREIESARQRTDIAGVVIIAGERIGAWGGVELVAL
jgi:ApbE superfamily uncharacterized protein (UPF0280 family)